jgi:predicted dienelactone hydrolase
MTREKNGRFMYQSRSLIKAVCCIAIVTSTLCFGAGYTEIKGSEFNLGVWYPSTEHTNPHRLGPFTTAVALDAYADIQPKGIVLLSHGNGGRYRNHYLTAARLAESGFFVIAPDHQADHYIGGEKSVSALAHRVNELRSSLEQAKQHVLFNNLDFMIPVHGLGYSLGGATILAAAGATISLDLYEAYCQINHQTDAEFCDDPGFVQRRNKILKKPVTMKPEGHMVRLKPMINGSISLIAPIAHVVKIEEQTMSHNKLLIIGLNQDIIAKPKYHAEVIAADFSSYKTSTNLAGSRQLTWPV